MRLPAIRLLFRTEAFDCKRLRRKSNRSTDTRDIRSQGGFCGSFRNRAASSLRESLDLWSSHLTGANVFDFRFEHFGDRKSTRLNSSHVAISYAVFCLKKKTKH